LNKAILFSFNRFRSLPFLDLFVYLSLFDFYFIVLCKLQIQEMWYIQS